MKCPYCKTEMEKGFIGGGRGVYWSEKKSPFFVMKSRGDIVVAKMSGVESYLCRKCRKIITNNYYD